ncbi:MAG: FAD-dependent oxidoreductase [Thermodesulfobacteriota bacterium]
MTDRRPVLVRSFSRPPRGVGDRVATFLAERIGIRPVQSVAGARDGPLRADGATSVVVAGGGLAGMSAAIRLASRGVRVRLIERESYLGGKVGAFPVRLADGEQHVVEHGFHGFFLQYYNLYELLREARVPASDFPLVDDYVIQAADGRSEGLRGYPRTPPWNVLAMARRSPFLNMREARRMKSFATMRDAFVLYDPDEVRARWDATSFAELSRRMGLEGTGFDAIFRVFGHSFFSESASVSAAEIVKNFHFFFFANPEGLLFRYCRTDFEQALWGPLRRHLESLGGVVELGTEVVAVERNGAGRFAVRVLDAAGGDRGEGAERGERSLAADEVVLALDVPGLKRVVAASTALTAAHPELARAADALAPPQPYAVVRVWGDRDCLPGRASFTSLFGYEPLDSVTVYHRLQEASRDWVAGHGGGVFELHAYTPPAEDARDPEHLEALLVAQLRRAFPELDGMRILQRHARVRWDFPGFPVGGAASQPRTSTAVPGLHLAGDFVRLDVPVALMEGAVASGVAAANAILAGLGLAPEPIWSVPPRGVLRRLLPGGRRGRAHHGAAARLPESTA